MVDRLEWKRLEQLPDGSFYNVKLDPADYKFGEDVRTGSLSIDFVKHGGEWTPRLVYTDSAILRRVKTKEDTALEPQRGAYLACSGTFNKDTGAANPPSVGRYNGKDLGEAPNESAYLRIVAEQKAKQLKADRLLRVKRGGQWRIIDAEQGEEAPFISLANDPKGTGLRPNCHVKESGDLKLTTNVSPMLHSRIPTSLFHALPCHLTQKLHPAPQVPAFRWDVDTLEMNQSSELRWEYGDAFGPMPDDCQSGGIRLPTSTADLRCISIKQPFASAIMARKKLVENRSWGPSIGGEGVWLVVHSSKDAVTESPNDEHAKHLQQLRAVWPQMPPIGTLPTSSILGLMHISGVRPASDLTDPQAVGPQCWEIDAVAPFEEPIGGIRGSLNLWSCPSLKLPPNLAVLTGDGRDSSSSSSGRSNAHSKKRAAPETGSSASNSSGSSR